jgi:hypothetical protein
LDLEQSGLARLLTVEVKHILIDWEESSTT